MRITKRHGLSSGFLALLFAGPLACTSVAIESPDAGNGGGGPGGASTTIGTGGAPTTTSSTGTGGAACTSAADCAGADTPCQQRTCTAGTCGISNISAGTPIAEQALGDCLVVVCDGTGGPITQPDDTDVPDDGNPCTADLCSAGVPSHANEPLGTACGEALLCDGAGQCVGCVSPDECPGQDTTCQQRVCTAGVCGVTNAAAGTLLPAADQTGGDCLVAVCDGNGGIATQPDDTDLPDDANPCTADVCAAGLSSHTNELAGTVCGAALICDGAGQCVGCVSPSDCPGQDTTCHQRTCTAGVCGVANAPANTALPAAEQTPSDCQLAVCDANGGITTIADDTDTPTSTNACAAGACVNGAISSTLLPAGTACTQNGGAMCAGAGACVQCLQASDCPGQDTTCQQRACAGSACGVANTPANTPLPPAQQTAGDCQVAVCDGNGGVTNVAHDADLPASTNACVAVVCVNGASSSAPLPAGVACNQYGGTLCDGAGACVQCLQPSDCSGQDTACYHRTCTAGACGFSSTPANTPLPAAQQTPGDCQSKVCNGTGGVSVIDDDSDVPTSTNACVAVTCLFGMAYSPPRPAGTACNQNGGLVCDGDGACVQCNQGSDCASGVCQAHVCQAPTCSDGVRNQGEVATDCGGPCTMVCPTVVLIGTGPSGTIGATYHPGGVWTTTSLGGMSTDPPSVAFMSTGEAVGAMRLTQSGSPSDNSLQYTTWAAATWTPFSGVGPGIATTHGPSVSADGASASAAYRGLDGKYYLLARNGGAWSAAQPVVSFYGVHSSGVSAPAFTQQPGALVFIGDDHRLYGQRWNPLAWEPAEWIDACDDVTPSVTTTANGLAAVAFVKGQTGMFASSWPGGAYPFDGVTPTGDPLAMHVSSQRTYVAFRRLDGYVHSWTYSGSFAVIQPISTPNVMAVSSPALAAGVAGAEAELAFIQPDGVAYHSRLIGSTWTPPVAIGGSNLTHVAIASWSP